MKTGLPVDKGTEAGSTGSLREGFPARKERGLHSAWHAWLGTGAHATRAGTPRAKLKKIEPIIISREDKHGC